MKGRPTASTREPPPTGESAEGPFEEATLCHLDVVYRVALKLCGDPNDAEDLTQETFLKAQTAFDRFKLNEFGARAWLLRILYNLFLNRAGRARRITSLSADLSLDDFAAELSREELPMLADGQMNWEGFDEELKYAVQSLAPEYRYVLLLWALGDMSYREIADASGCAMGTVMSRLHRARQQLAQGLAEYAAKRGIRQSPPIEQT